jgi:aspartyl protease family protein
MIRYLGLVAVTLSVGALVVPDQPVNQPARPETQKAGSVAKSEPRQLAGNGFAAQTIARSPDGHFYAMALVNGAPIRFLIDTGATHVVLTPADAQAAGLQFSPSEFSASAQGAGGQVQLKPVTLDRLAIGALETGGVEAAIAQSGLTISLLGQSWLSRVGTVTITGDTMELR